MKGIPLKTWEVQAILDNRKSVMRRVVKPQPEKDACGMWHWKDCQWMDGGLGIPQSSVEDYAPYRSGDILYVQEMWAQFYETMYSDHVIGYRYFSETNEEIKERLPEYLNWYWPGRWSPSIHMPREAARIFLRVTDARVGRLQNITEEQAEKEGCTAHGGNIALDEFEEVWHKTLKLADRALYGWETSPWVWVIEFERISEEEVNNAD